MNPTPMFPRVVIYIDGIEFMRFYADDGHDENDIFDKAVARIGGTVEIMYMFYSGEFAGTGLVTRSLVTKRKGV